MRLNCIIDKKSIMRTVLYTLLFAALGINQLPAQKLKETEVPPKVREAYKKKYPAAKDGKWEKEGINYEVELISNKKKTSIVYDEKGKLIETETSLKPSELPKGASDFIMSNFKGKNPTEASKIIDAEGKISYEVEIDHLDYIFDDKGTFLKQEEDEADPAGEVD